MEHTAIPEPPGFSNLSKVEQVRYLQALWDRIAENPSEVPVPEAHLEVAEQRLAEHEITHWTRLLESIRKLK
jgi:hypothetical protein